MKILCFVLQPTLAHIQLKDTVYLYDGYIPKSNSGLLSEKLLNIDKYQVTDFL